MKKISLMNQYLANLSIINTKLHNLHWNVTGLQFMPVHKFTEELYNDVFEKFDQVAEQIKILGHTPLSTTKAFLEVATIAEIEPKDFHHREVLEILQSDLRLQRILVNDIRNLADEENDYTTVSMVEDHIAGYDKNLWFLSAMLK